MILACHQPQYLSWLGLYHKMAQSDVYVYLDEVQFKKREFQNRNRIKSPNGELWLTVPVLTKERYDQKVKDVEIDPTQKWAPSHLQSFVHNYSKAPFYKEHEPFLKEIYGKDWRRLIDLNVAWDDYMRKQFAIKAEIVYESKVGSEGAATDRLVSLCRRLKADVYLSGQGGKDYLEEEKFARAGIVLRYQEFRHPTYPQRHGDFLSHLAAADYILNCDPASRRALLAR